MVPDREMRIGAKLDEDATATGGFLRRHVSKMAGQIIPPVVATVMGAWIIANFVNTRPPEPKPAATQTAPEKPVAPVTGAASSAASTDASERPATTQLEPPSQEKSSAEKTPPSKQDAVRVIPLQATPHPTAVKPVEQTRHPQDPPKPAATKQDISKKPVTAAAEAHNPTPDHDTKASAHRASASSDVETLPRAAQPRTTPKAVPQPDQDALVIAREALERLKEQPNEPTSNPALAKTEPGGAAFAKRTMDNLKINPANEDLNKAATEGVTDHTATTTAAPHGENAVPPALPPPVTVTEPPSPRGAPPIDLSPPQPRVNTTRDPDAPIPPADIPNAGETVSPPGFIILR